MLAQLPIVALAALSAVNASPLGRRQETSVISSAVATNTNVVSSAVETVTSAVESATSAASSAATSVASEVSSAVESATGTASSVAPVATGTTGNESYPLYPCPTGFLLTYVEQNVTVDVPITQVGQAIGNWSDSPIFPNVTDAMGGTEVGATHTLNLAGGIALPEVLVNATTNSTSGYAMWNWNYTAAPLTAGNVSISNYTTVFSIFDPDFPTTQMIGNTTTAQIYVNFCASEQAAGAALVGLLTAAELAAFQQVAMGGAMAGNETMSSMMPSMAMSSSMPMMSSSMPMTSSVASGAESVTSAAASGVTSAASGATSAAAGVTSAIASAVAGATSSA